MKIVNFPKFVVSISIIICLVSFCISMATSKVFSATPIKYDVITVSAGDTLWEVALRLEGDISENIYNIKEINNLESSIIYEGQKLIIPIKK